MVFRALKILTIHIFQNELSLNTRMLMTTVLPSQREYNRKCLKNFFFSFKTNPRTGVWKKHFSFLRIILVLFFNLSGLVEHLKFVQASEFLYGMPLRLVSAVNFTLSTLLQQRKEITCELISQGGICNGLSLNPVTQDTG